MPESAIRVKNISKYFLLGKPQNESFTEGLINLGRSLLKNSGNVSKKNGFWALKNISFNIKKGETLGIFGRNGAGKTTLLKILSEVTQPTQGEVEIEGKIASVLEVGMGFHPDLTGKENIFLSARILGMSRNEIKNKAAEIIEFSGIGQFIDMPIKHYSSGMYVRLAFSLAAHISAEILIFDEVLSVGDAEFKLKTLKKISELTNEGKTIILVTHNLNEILNLCNRAIIMDNGQIKALGRPSELISEYVEDVHNVTMNDPENTANSKLTEKEMPTKNSRVWKDMKIAPGNKTARIKKIIVKRQGGELTDDIYTKNDIEVEIYYQKLLEQNTIDVGFTLYDNTGNNVFASTTVMEKDLISCNEKGEYKAICEIPGNYLNIGVFTMNVFLVENKKEIFRSLPDVVLFKIHINKDLIDSPLIKRFPGPLRPSLNWGVEKI